MQATNPGAATGRGDCAAVTAPPCRVLGIVGEPLTGVSYVRFTQPFDHLRECGFELTTLGESLTLTRGAGGYAPDPSLLDDVSMLIFPQMVASPIMPDGSRVRLVEPLCDEAARRGIKIVYSVDDHLQEIQEHNPGYDVVNASSANLHTILERADAFIVTGEELRRSLAHLGRPTFVLPNAVDPAHWKTRPRAGGLPRIGWTGSSSHLDDLLMLLPAIRKLQQRVSFEFVIQGLVDMPLADQVRQIRLHRNDFVPAQRKRAGRFMELMDQLRTVKHRHVPFGATADFFDLLPSLDLDLGLCPLLDTPFNRNKSANKFYEYAATGTMTIASDVTPYREEVSVTAANDSDSWCETLERYLLDQAARERELDRQRAFVLAERNIEHLKDHWAAALHDILSLPARS